MGELDAAGNVPVTHASSDIAMVLAHGDTSTVSAEEAVTLSLEEIVDRLDRHAQRATYGAVAGLLGQSPRGLLRDRERGRKYTWIVNRNTGLPTGYADDQLDPRVRESGPVIATGGELREWLERVG